MEIKKVVLQYEEYPSLDELPASDRELMEKAAGAVVMAYAPYSRFRVGAAVRLANGKVITGSNQENAAYPSGLCAERVAMFHAQSQFPDVPIEAVAITAASEDFKKSDPVSPCGSCRQVMAEYENRHNNTIRVIMASNSSRAWAVNGIENLLPLKFMLEELKKKSR
jgi:cytidine deaminase